MHVAFLTTSYWAYGELLIALEFAKQLLAAGWQPHFFIPPTHEKTLKAYPFAYTVLMPKLGNVNRVLLQDYEHRCRPQLVILSDFLNYHFCERHYGLRVEDLQIFSGRVGTFDNFDWTLSRRQMDTYGFGSKTVSEVKIEDYGFRLVPCPIANPLQSGRNAGDTFYYPLLGDVPTYDEAIRARCRTELGLPQERPVLLVTSAVWQQTHRLYPHVQGFVEAADEVYRDILLAVARQGLMIYVGAPGFFADPPPNVVVLSHLPPDLFQKYALAADLFVTRNLTSTTVAKFALAGVPTAALTSSLHTTNRSREPLRFPFSPTPRVEQLVGRLEICYPYRMYPVGWHKFLAPVMKGNPYLDVVRELELFDEQQTVAAMCEILERPQLRDEIRHRAGEYRQLLGRLDSPAAILGKLVQVT